MSKLVFLLSLVVFINIDVFSAEKTIDPVSLSINENTVLTLSFPSEIKYADFGDKYIIGDYTYHNNILQVHTDTNLIDKTSLSVVTADGKYYSFLVSYNNIINHMSIDMSKVDRKITKENTFESRQLELSLNQTSHLIFDEEVTDILIGNNSIAATYADKIENIVRCKAIDSAFHNISLTIITKSGTCYPFIVNYNPSPDMMSLQIAKEPFSDDNHTTAIFDSKNVNEKEMNRYAKAILHRGNRINSIGSISPKLTFGLSSISIKNDIIMYALYLTNTSIIDYEIDFLKTYITDKKRGKLSTLQEEEIEPIYQYSNTNSMIIPGKETKIIILFFKKFTVPDKRVLYMEVFEKNGGRHIGFSITNKEIFNAEEINL